MTSCPPGASTRQPMSQKFVCATCLISGRSRAREPHERRARVGADEGGLDRRFVHAGPQARVDRLEDAAVERHQVRHERHAARRAPARFRRHAGERTLRTRRCCRGTPSSASARSASCRRPETPDFASMMIPGSSRPAADERLQRRARPQSDSSRHTRPAARSVQLLSGAARSSRRRSPSVVDGECGYQRCRWAIRAGGRRRRDRTHACRDRQAPERSRQRAYPAAPRNTASVSVARRSMFKRFDRRVPDFRQCREPPGLRCARRHGDPHVGVGMPREPAEEFQPGIPGDSRDADPDSENTYSSEP